MKTSASIGVLIVACTLASCGDDAEEARVWDSCELKNGMCWCEIRPGGSDLDYPPADSCEGMSCCSLITGTDATLCLCREPQDDISCDEWVEMSNGSAVTQCPPPGEALASSAMCIPEGGSCPNRPSQEVSGCCDGLLCLASGDESAGNVCQSISGGRERALQCEHATLSRVAAVEVTSGELATQYGTTTFQLASVESATVGEGGCLTSLRMGFTGDGEDGGGSCELALEATVQDGEWQLRRALGSLHECAGFTDLSAEDGMFDVRAPEPLPFTFSYDGDGCGARFPDAYCVSGSFAWQLDGTVHGVEFQGSRLELTGVVCGESDADTCDEVSLER